MNTINYNAGAKVMMLEKPDAAGHARGGPIKSTTLGEAVRYVMSLAEDEGNRSSIAVGLEAGTDKTLLQFHDILAISRRSDFPGKGA